MDFKTKQEIKRHIPTFLQKTVKRFVYFLDKRPPIVYNVGKNYNNTAKVLFSYIPNFLFYEDLDSLIGTREKESSVFLSALLSNGCCVDICSVDYKGPFKQGYDYIFGQGKAFREARKVNPNAKSILYLTEMPPTFSYKKEKERIDYLYQRHQIKVGYERSGKYFIDSDFDGLEGCIMLGRESDAHYVENTKMYMLRPTGLKNTDFCLSDRNMASAKSNFMWIGSSGAVHKGLDILLDVFSKHPELHLHVLGLQPDERKLLKKIMPNNVDDYGFVQISSIQFKTIVKKCAFIIYPSCSERVATSVITAMNHGLIPLVSEICSIDAEECGEILTSYDVDDIEKVVLKWSGKNQELLDIYSKKALETAQRLYTIEKYSEDIRHIISQIL